MNAIEEAHTVTTRLIPTPIRSPEAFVESLALQVRPEEDWVHFTTTTEAGTRLGFALPVARRTNDGPLLALVAEIHTRLVAWWLTVAWRTRQLSNAARNLTETHQTIAVAACVRPLMETAAAVWVDGNKIVTTWDEMKRSGPPSVGGSIAVNMVTLLDELFWGSKFDKRVPDLAETWAKYSRSNVLGQIDKLSKSVGTQFQESYQWLCNTVHPSVGNALVFSAPPLMDPARTHLLQGFSGRPLSVTNGETTMAERTVHDAITWGASVSLMVLRETLDATLRAIDDLALTTKAPRLVRAPYWRQLVPKDRGPCPCRSGTRVQRCRHAWGDPAPRIPRAFHPASRRADG